eukprot:TRINITY_DN49299_c1_g1_i3.p4 TRINITY_DN49299_c1_g1~~TRINITY_DN49299_c1_g1_i3.p4  ORF type:complete len:102 (+),score=2.75 TRINITY_DN49299_c1_g1_i3:99-404(+)
MYWLQPAPVYVFAQSQRILPSSVFNSRFSFLIEVLFYFTFYFYYLFLRLVLRPSQEVVEELTSTYVRFQRGSVSISVLGEDFIWGQVLLELLAIILVFFRD